MIAFLKSLAPTSIYMVGLFCAVLAAVGRPLMAIMLVVFLSPLRNVVDRLQDYPMGNQFLDVLFVAMVFGWLASSIFLRAQFMEKSSLNVICFILIFYTLFSVAIGGQWLYGEFGLDRSDPRVQDAKNFCLLPILFLVSLNGIKTREWVDRTFMVMCAATLLMGYYTFSQVTWYSSLQSRAKIHGTFAFLGPNEVAAFYDTTTIIMLSVYFSMKRGWKKMVLLGLVLLNFYCLVFMYSRAAYAATYVGLFILCAFKKKQYLVPLVLALICWQVVLPEKARQRIEGTKNVLGEYDESAARRLQVWNKAVQIFQENPLSGIGYGSFRTLGLTLGDTHNIYVKIAAEQGLIGLSIFAILIMCFLKEGWTLYKKGEDEESRALGLGFYVAVFVLLLNNMFGDRWSHYELSAYWWVFAALVARLNALSRLPKVDPAVVEAQNPKLGKAKPKLHKSQKFQRSLDRPQ
jgi:O-antigen ligase